MEPRIAYYGYTKDQILHVAYVPGDNIIIIISMTCGVCALWALVIIILSITSRKRARSDSILPLALNGTALDKVVTFKYLGMLLSDNLSWSNHISACTKLKARKVLGLLYTRRFYNYASNDCLKQLYISLARPHMEYAAALWDPHTARDIQLLENTQKFALKLITHNWDSSYQDLLALSDLYHLSLLVDYTLSYLNCTELFMVCVIFPKALSRWDLHKVNGCKDH